MAKAGESLKILKSNEQEQGGERKSIPMPVRLFKGVLAGILPDKSFTIQTDEMRTCLRIMRELTKCFLRPSLESGRFALWLIYVLDKVEKSLKNTQ